MKNPNDKRFDFLTTSNGPDHQFTFTRQDGSQIHFNRGDALVAPNGQVFSVESIHTDQGGLFLLRVPGQNNQTIPFTPSVGDNPINVGGSTFKMSDFGVVHADSNFSIPAKPVVEMFSPANSAPSTLNFNAPSVAQAAAPAAPAATTTPRTSPASHAANPGSTNVPTSQTATPLSGNTQTNNPITNATTDQFGNSYQVVNSGQGMQVTTPSGSKMVGSWDPQDSSFHFSDGTRVVTNQSGTAIQNIIPSNSSILNPRNVGDTMMVSMRKERLVSTQTAISPDGKTIEVQDINGRNATGSLGNDGRYHFSDGSIASRNADNSLTFDMHPNTTLQMGPEARIRMPNSDVSIAQNHDGTFNIVNNRTGDVLEYTASRDSNYVLNEANAFAKGYPTVDPNAWKNGWKQQTDPNGNTMWTSPDGKYSTSNADHAQAYANQQAAAAHQAQLIAGYKQNFTTNISQLANSNTMRQIELPNGRMVDVWGYGGKNSGLYDVYDSQTGKLIAHGDVTKVSDIVGDSLTEGGSSSAQQANEKKGDFIQRLLNNPAVAVPMAIMGGYGLYKGFEALGQQFSAMGLVNSAMGALTFASSAANLLNRLKFLHGNGGAYALAAIAVIALIGYLMGRKKKKDNALDTTKGDAAPMANTGAAAPTSSGTNNVNVQEMQVVKQDTTPKPWYKQLSSSNVFMITSAAALMAIGLNLGLSGPSSQSTAIKATELTGVRNALDSSVGGGKLPAIGTSVMGKVFVQSAENNGLTPDKVVYVSQETVGDEKNAPTYSANMISLNYQGYVTSPNVPSLSYIPMFYKDGNGALVAVPEANAALAEQRALAMAANSSNTSAAGAATALLLSGGNHN